jgi:SAM-dependent methyltransferase
MGAYRAYRIWIYRKLVAPLVRRGAESVLLVGAGVAEPFDLMKALNIEGLDGAVDIVAQEVDPEAARALAAAGVNVFLGEVEQMEDTFDIAIVQNVLHWAERPEELLAATAQRAKYIVLSQGYGYNNAAGFLLTAVLGAKRVVPSKEYVDGVVAQAGLEPLRDMPALKAYGLYVAAFRGREKK